LRLLIIRSRVEGSAIVVTGAFAFGETRCFSGESQQLLNFVQQFERGESRASPKAIMVRLSPSANAATAHS
jgi:hypothetical protein